MADSIMTASSSSAYTLPPRIGSSRIANELAPLSLNNRSSLGLPKLMPRSAVTRSSLTPSPTDSPDLLADSPVSEPNPDTGSSRSKPRQAKASHLSMMDFLAAEPRNDDTSAPNAQSRRNGGRKSFGLVPRLGNLGNSSSSNLIPPPKTSSSMSSSPSNGELASQDVQYSTRAESPQPKYLENFGADRRNENSTSHTMAKGKRKAIGEMSPPVQLKVIPITDSIIMFGSTQTSSNYSLSGLVVLSINEWRERRNSSPGTQTTRCGSPMGATSEDILPSSNVKSGSRRPSGTSDIGREGQTEELRIRSLQVIFSGFALYVDHTGRFSAMRLAHIKQDLLPQETLLPPTATPGQEYEIEFNLSVPGWLPSTLSTRFGGTFYCLEAKIEYFDGKVVSERMPMAALVPPRNTSRAASPSPLQSSVENSSYDSDTPATSAIIMSKDEQLRRLLGAQTKDQEGGSRKGSWLSKLAKGSKANTSSGTNSSSSAISIPTQTASEARSSSSAPNGTSAVPHSSLDGISIALSQAKAIVIARCREVVPVPVARMAIIGPEGLPEGAHQDPPPLTRSSSFDAATSRSRSSTITRTTILATPPRRSHSPPPLAPSVFNAPSDPAKLAAHAATQPPTPQRASSNTQVFHARGSAPRPSPTTSPSAPRNHRSQHSYNPSASTVPMRHFLHRPMLHPPADAQIPNVDGGLSFALTLTLPSYVSVDGPGSDVLSFGLQIEVGRSASWTKVRELGGLRLRDVELSCVQTERHSSVASRTFCHSYPLPLDSKIGPHELPIMEPWRGSDRERTSSQQEAAKLRAGYDRAMVEDHMELVRQGRAPLPSEQNVERVRVAVVGPPSSHSQAKSEENRRRKEDGSKGKEKDREDARDASVGRSAPAAKKHRRRSLPASSSAPSGLVGSLPLREGSSDPLLDDFVPPLPDREDTEANRRTTGRGRRAYQSAIRGLSNLATAVMDITLDNEGGGYGPSGSDAAARRKKPEDDPKQTALYSFAGSDGHGVDLTKGRVRMAINLPLVSNSIYRSKMAGTPRLVADFESPFIRVRHKLKVKLGFGFGSKPLGGEGDGNWGQALVMCVPVRFTDSAPREVREQFAPLPIAQVTSSVADLPSMPKGNKVGGNDAPLLPSYNQLFREDGSRLADEGEDLPQYPGPANRRISGTIPPSGSVTAPSPSLGSNGEVGTIDELTSFDNRITPSRVVDESVPEGALSDVVSRQQQLELEEMEEEEEEEHQLQTSDRMNETVNLDDELDEEFGEDDAIGAFSSSDQARSGLDDDDSSTGEDEYHNC